MLVKYFFQIFYGRGDRTRTCGILLPKQALYQTELHPDIFIDAALTRYLYIKHYPWFVLYTFLT